MPLITPNDATNKFNVSAQNLDTVLKGTTKDDITTKLVLSCFNDIQKSQLGWWFSIKKFFARTFSYPALLTFPMTGIAGGVWYYAEAIKTISLTNYAIWGTSLGALLAADFAIGKIIGTRPITALLIASYDAYREGARTISKVVAESYTKTENQISDLIKAHRETIKNELLVTYAGIAKALAERYTGEGAVEISSESMENCIPTISKTFAELGLSQPDIDQILGPLKDVLLLIQASPKKAM